MNLVLASTSRYRRDLLARLGLAFTMDAPEIDETRLAGEAPDATAQRLAQAKALAVARRHPESLVIGSDQVAVCGEEILGKPGTHERAVQQLRMVSGREATFYTAVCVHNTKRTESSARIVPCRIRFRPLDPVTIERYVAREQPFDCAGSAKAEGLGIALIESMHGEDPTALLGLPLIALVDLLREHGIEAV